VLLGTYPKSKYTCSSFAHKTLPLDFKTCACMRESCDTFRRVYT
jgi:hypothetical protein